MNAEVTPLLVLHGVNGQVEVYPNKVRIRRKGVLSKLTQGLFAGEKDIYFQQIGSILVKRAGLMTRGYISFAPLGAVERRKGLLGTTHDENAVRFKRNQSAVVEDIRATSRRIWERRRPLPTWPTSSASSANCATAASSRAPSSRRKRKSCSGGPDRGLARPASRAAASGASCLLTKTERAQTMAW